MDKRFGTELNWIIGTGLLTHLIWRSILGDLVYNGKPLEIQDYDTYLIVPKFLLLGLTFLALLLFMYLLRWVHARTINKFATISTVTLTTAVSIFLFFSWLTSLETIRILGRSLYSEINGADRVQMPLLSHAILTFALGIVTLFGMTIGYKLVAKKE